jgi:ADP-heptose:LPS heptosyltransferase
MKILVIRFSSIGDIVLTTPIVRSLKQQLHNAEIHYCTKIAYKSLLEANPYIDKLHFLDNNLMQLAGELRHEEFDWVIDLHNNLRTKILKYFIDVRSVSLDKLNWKKWLLVNLKINKLPPVHIVDRYWDTVERLGANDDGFGLDYFIPPNDVFSISILPLAYQKDFAIYAIGGQHETKKLPLTKMKELVDTISLPLILVGGKEDEANGKDLVNYVQDRKNVLNLCGKLSINQSASVIEQSKKVYTHDTGMMHIAAAFKKEIVVIWGNTIPEFGMYPFRTKYTSLEIQGLKCRPCSKIGFHKCPKGHFKCMNLQKFPISD